MPPEENPQRTRKSSSEEMINRGIDAKEFLRYYNENPYFRNLLATMVQDRAAFIVSAAPNQTLLFSQARIEMEMIKSIIDKVKLDIVAGRQAQETLEGKDKGIL